MEKNKTSTQILFALIQSEICGKEFDEKYLDDLSNEMLGQLYKISKSHDIGHLIASALNKQKLLTQDEISQKFQKQWMMAVYRYEKINYELKRVSDVLENHGIAFLPLKGSVLRKYYPEPWMRTSCDIDILIHPEDAETAIQVLCEVGFTLQKSTTTYDYQMIAPGGVHLELHFSLKQDASILQAETILESVWDECELETDKQYHYYMRNEMFLFYHIVHMANHFTYGGCGIRPIIDLWLLTNKMEIDKDKLRFLLSQSKLLEFYDASVELSKVWLENAPHNNITLRMEQFILTGGVYGNSSTSALMKAAKGESKIRSFFKLLFIPKANLEVSYPNLKKHPILLPFYQIKRWFRIFNRKKRQRIERMTAARNAVDAKEENQTRTLLYDLGLRE